MEPNVPADPHVVIVGGGFGGLYAAKKLAKEPVNVTLIDRRNHHLFQPLLYQVATAGLSPGNIAVPLRGILRRQKRVRVLMAEVRDLDAKANTISLADGTKIGYDFLILATGSSHFYFGNEHWAAHAPGLKTLEDALDIRRRVLLAFERAERTENVSERGAYLTFIIVGGGPTGLELAGALGEMAHMTLEGNFRSIDPDEAKIILVEASDRVMNNYPAELSEKAEESLNRLGVTIMTSSKVTAIDEGQVTVKQGDSEIVMPARTVLWAAGIQASSLGKVVQSQTEAEIDRSGRVMVEPDLSVRGFPNLFVIGDLAHFAHGVDRSLPGVAPVAMQQGRFVADVIAERVKKPGEQESPALFRYSDKGTMATIGRASAIAVIGKWKLSGYPAWLSWLFIHLLYLAEFDNRVMVLLQWVWNYFTYRRGVRLILNVRPTPPDT